MAKAPKKSSPTLFNMMKRIRGEFDFKIPETTQISPTRDLIDQTTRTKLLTRINEITANHRTAAISNPMGIYGLVHDSSVRERNKRAENRRILKINPDVAKAARLMIASCFSPTDLNCTEIKITVDDDGISGEQKELVEKKITEFYQKRLDLVTEAPEWAYEFGYEAGAVIMATIPLESLEAKIDESGTESLATSITKLSDSRSMFNFSAPLTLNIKEEEAAIESFFVTNAEDLYKTKEKPDIAKKKTPTAHEKVKSFIDSVLAKEALSFSDNPEILLGSRTLKKKTNKKVNDALGSFYGNSTSGQLGSIKIPDDTSKDRIGEPVVIKLPTEAVTIIHTPGDPSDHQGYLVLLDLHGNPVDSSKDDLDPHTSFRNANDRSTDIFRQVYDAYGLTSSSASITNDTMNRLYNEIVRTHLNKRLKKSGFGAFTMVENDAMMRCMFSRFVAAQGTRILFIPAPLVSYMYITLDETGYGQSELENVKHTLGLQTAIRISRVMASIKAAMDKRKIEAKFDPKMMESPEAMLATIGREYVNKNTMHFSTDPNDIQGQMAAKSLSVILSGIPGMEDFSITNEPDDRSGSFNFDDGVYKDLKDDVISGLRIPPAAMNNIGEDEYARSVTTTNLFFNMDVGIVQNTIKEVISNFLRNYGFWSKDLRALIADILKPKNDETPVAPDIDDKTSGESGETVDLVDKVIMSIQMALPKPNVAPSKTQFEAFEAMVNAITGMVNAILPDELVGVDDQMTPALHLIRGRIISDNIKAYLASSGMSGIEVPTSDFSPYYSEIGTTLDALKNLEIKLKDNQRISEKSTAIVAPPVEGYE